MMVSGKGQPQADLGTARFPQAKKLDFLLQRFRFVRKSLYF